MKRVVIRAFAFTLGCFASMQLCAQSVADMEQRDELIEAFLAEKSFGLVQRLDELPQDVQNLLEKRSDGTFRIAERGEVWNMSDLSHPTLKGASHIISGVSNELAVVLHNSGGIGVTTRIRIYDRRRGVGVSCLSSRVLAAQWNGSNHTREIVAPFRSVGFDPLPVFVDGEPMCWTLPYD